MNLNGLGFAFFIPVVFLVHWMLPRDRRWQNGCLLAASLLFYASWNLRMLPLLVFATLVDYLVGRELERTEPPRVRRLLLAVSIVANLGVLGFVKYQGFFAESLNALLATVGLGTRLEVLQIALPIGLSYVTLIRVGAVLEVYHRRVAALRSPLDYGVFVMFFPQIIAGPITRASAMFSQLAQPRRLNPDDLARGCAMFLGGFALKAFVADWLAPNYVQPVFADPAAFSLLSRWVALGSYGAQIFADFAGYSWMAIGCALWLGLRLPANFDRPFLSRSMMEFWRRWHISLNTWLFDYLFGPLTTSRGFFRSKISLGFLIVFAISGLWHGPRWTFVVWGLLHGLALVAGHRWDRFWKSLCRRDRIWVTRRKSRIYTLVAWGITQFFFAITLVPFRSPDLGRAWGFLSGLVAPGGSASLNLASGNAALCLAIVAGYHLGGFGFGQRVVARFRALPDPLRGLCYAAAIALLLLLVPVGAGTFIYAQF